MCNFNIFTLGTVAIKGEVSYKDHLGFGWSKKNIRFCGHINTETIEKDFRLAPKMARLLLQGRGAGN